MKNGATIDDLQTLISNLSTEYELDPVLEDEGLIVIYPREEEPEGAEEPGDDEADVPPEVQDDLDTPESEEDEEPAEPDAEAEPEDDEDKDEPGDVDESEKTDSADGSTDDEDDDAADPDEDAPDTSDNDDGLTKVERRARRIEEAMTGAGKMTSSEVADEADLDSTTDFHNTRASVDWLAEKIESEPLGEGTGKLYWIPANEEDQEPEEGESESADGYFWYTDLTPGAVLQVEPVEKFRCGSCGEEFEDDEDVIDHMQEEGHRTCWDVKSRQDPADLLD